jgi:hypothetical protein
VVSDTSNWDETRMAEAHYANCFKIGHNTFEFILDCGQSAGEGTGVILTARIITNPHSAKSLYQTLQQSIEDYERTFGLIPGNGED